MGGVELKEVELMIIGSGPAGVAAAVEAARAGVKVCLVDENPMPGGQIYRQLSTGFEVQDAVMLGRDYLRGQKLLAEFEDVCNQVEYDKDTLIWGILPDNEVSLLQADRSFSMRYRKLIVAVGAYDRPVPFPGWTLPGVFTAGGAQRLVKTQRVLPGERILLVGTGPLLLALAKQITDAGGTVVGIVETGRIHNRFRLLKAAWGQWQLISDAWHYFRGIRKAGIPLWRGHIILEARGEGRVEEVVVAEVDEQWNPRAGTQRTLSVDTVCVGYGFIPSTELTRLAQCEHRYDPLLGGWIPVRAENMETSVADIYAVGDCAGVAGSMVALDEGRIAGLAAAHSLGYLSSVEALGRMRPIRKSLAALMRLRRVLDEISVPRPGLYQLAKDDTIVCRCEEITLGEIREALKDGANDMNEVKRMTRMGMGHCQGRMCGPALQEIIALEKGLPAADIAYLNPRPPVKPIPLSALAEHTNSQ
ncbi:MAG: FAD-dependent oxidoreductase [Deltaproteobacteria bacterium]|nr:FAD-dependent oxidoreductase [Deltaproteobacteria bacterium]MBW1962333.1 FAD-dependent oxidoreductase [Deltaproteobacteria bacterium]